MATTRTFTLPDIVGEFLDTLPPRAKSKFVSDAIQAQMHKQDIQDAIDALHSITPLKNTSSETSVELIQKLRAERSQQLLANSGKDVH